MLRRLGRTLTLSVALALVLGASAQAATYTVDSTADGGSPSCAPGHPAGTCTLREAVAQADAADGNTVSIPAGTYVLNAVDPSATAPGELQVTHSMTIVGAGARSTIISANKRSRVLDVYSTSASVKVTGVTITGGQVPATNVDNAGNPGNEPDGGGILTCGDLELDGVAVTGNTSQLLGAGVATPTRGEFGDLLCMGIPLARPRLAITPTVPTITLNGTTISGNTVTGGGSLGRGGGLYVSGNLRATNSTISNNSISQSGSNVGGGIGADSGAVILLNVTIAGNSVSGGTANVGGGLGGSDRSNALVDRASLDAQNTIIADNTAGGTRSDCNLEPTGTPFNGVTGFTVARTDHNLSSDASCGFTDPGSKQNTEPALGPLTNNGGQTDTRAINASSPAFDAGDNTGCPSIDQTGTPRPQHFICDIGAFEYVPKADLSVTIAATPGRLIAGSNVTYTITVRNNGPDAAGEVVVTDTLGPGQFLRTARASQGFCTGRAPVTCALGTIASGASATVRIVAGTSRTLGLAAPRAARIGSTTTVTDKAAASAAQPDTNAANNAASASATVLPFTAPRITVQNHSRRGRHRCVAAGLVLPVRIASATRVREVRVTLNGVTILITRKTSFTVRVRRGRLRRGRNVVVVVARNTSGNARLTRLVVYRCGVRARQPGADQPDPDFTG